MHEMLMAYRDATQAIIELFAPSKKQVDTARLEELVKVRDSLIAQQPALPNLRENAELAALADEIARLDAMACELVARSMQQTHALIQSVKNTNRQMVKYATAYTPDAYFIDKRK